MAFELVDARRCQAAPISVNKARLRKSGTLILHCDTLSQAGIDGAAVLLVDRETQRVGLRKPTADEAALAIRPKLDKMAARAGGQAFDIRAALERGGWGVGKKARYSGDKRVVSRADGTVVVLLEEAAK